MRHPDDPAAPPVHTPQDRYGDSDPQIAYFRVYFALMRINRTLMPPIEAALRAQGIADPVWYEILLAAEEAGENGVQMLDLQRRLFLPQYTVSRHIARMQKAGLVQRKAASGKGRGQTVFVTDAARGVHEQVWKEYSRQVRAALETKLDTQSAYALLDMLNRLYP
ncbi:MarR family winged helix-turn-helix transcriptional regulator [Roseinatronobacter sp. NSM]|uniref:MarR family winged helix-turn-helix transcriptional regulator n=1 Tax=Roseinatronobacter sp. NSM TaxID=3457785 RepID=UPI0040357E06